jgi:hypothetical protein
MFPPKLSSHNLLDVKHPCLKPLFPGAGRSVSQDGGAGVAQCGVLCSHGPGLVSEPRRDGATGYARPFQRECSPVTRATRAARKFGICPSFKGHVLSPRAKPYITIRTFSSLCGGRNKQSGVRRVLSRRRVRDVAERRHRAACSAQGAHRQHGSPRPAHLCDGNPPCVITSGTCT